MVFVRRSIPLSARRAHARGPMPNVSKEFARVAILSLGMCLAILAVRLLAIGSGSGSIALTSFDVAYSQDFNTLANSGTSSSLPTGWFIDESGTSAAVNGMYAAGTGSGTAGDTYSFGATGSTERALGDLRSGTLVPIIGASFTNNTGGTIAILDVAYTGEQWRLGAANRGPDRLDFQYSANATSLITGAWTDVDPLDFSSPDAGLGTTVGLRDGNSPAFRTTIAGQITGLTLPPGGTIWMRWLDVDVSGADDGLAVDDFSITPHGGVVPTDPSGVGTANPATVSAGDTTTLTVAVTPGSTPTSTGLTVTANLSAIGGSATQTFVDNGGSTWTFATTVPLGTTTGAKLLPFTVADAQGRIGNGSISLTVTAPPVITAIHDIQGAGSTSPFVGQAVTTEGLVTARRFNNGFFIQAPDAEADGDSNTSESIFIFTSAAAPAAAQVGNRVRVTGTVSEFKSTTDPISLPLTEITSPSVELLSTSNPLPTAITLTSAETDPAGLLGQLEHFEGMRVHVDTLNVVAPTQGSVNEANATGSSNGVYYGVLPSVLRPFREAGVELPAPLPPGSPCCVTRFDGNPEKIRVNSIGQTVFGLGDATNVTTGAIVSNITGVLDYSVHAYTILPDFGAQGSVTGVRSYAPATAAGPHRFTIATANLERFFDTVADPNTSDAVLTATAYAKRLSKVGLQICDVLRAPDIIGVEEVENLAVLQDIAGSANARPACGGTQYAAYLFEGNDPGGIDDGFLVNLNRVVVNDVHQEGKDTQYTNPNNGQLDLLNDRPPTVLHATISVPGDAQQRVTVIANHLRSLNGIDEDPGDGNRVRTKRLKQAEYLGHLIETLQFEGDPLVAVGDFNAFEFSDGYVDVIGTIKGTPVPADQVVLSSTDVPNVSSPLTDLIEADATANRYSYSFDGNAQSLDHLLATQVAVQMFDHVEWGHSNADFPEAFRGDETRPERLSDHDPVVAYFVLPANTTTTVTASPDPAHLAQDITFTATVTATLPVTSGFVQFSDDAGYSASIAVVNGQASVTVPASAFGAGSHTMSVTYADGVALAPSSGSTPFTVIDNYAFSGFFRPVDNLPALNQVKAGLAIPVKFSLGGNQGLSVFADGYPRSEAIPCESSALAAGIEETVTAGGSSLSYDSGADQYIYVWKTDKTWGGSCRQFVAKLTDGTTQRANFKFSK